MRFAIKTISITILGLAVWTIPFQGFSYFEDRLLCTIQQDTVTVRIDTQGDSENTPYCFDILQRIAKKDQILEADLLRAQGYLENGNSETDQVYRNQVIKAIQQSRAPYETMRSLIFSAIRDYETELFISTKGLVGVYLQPEYEDISAKLKQGLQLKERIVQLGNNQQFDFVLAKIQERETTLMVLRAIKQSSSFDSLIPALQSYFALQGPKDSAL